MKKLLLVAAIGLTTGWACAGVKTFKNDTNHEIAVRLIDTNGRANTIVIPAGKKSIFLYSTTDAAKVTAFESGNGKWNLLGRQGELTSLERNDELNSNREFKIVDIKDTKDDDWTRLQIVATRR